MTYDLAVNYYYGFTTDYIKTQVNTQDNTGYVLDDVSYYSNTALTDPISFNDALTFQSYYTHNILSGRPVSPEELSADYILPLAFDRRIGPAVSKAVAQAARDSGVARL